MRIDGINSSMNITNIYKTNAESQKGKLNKAEQGDRIEISNIAKSISDIDDPIVIDEAKKIEEIKYLMENGSYKIDSKKLAQAILKSIR